MKIYASTQRILKADDGKVLTNGETFAKTVVMPVDADDSAWREITEAEAQEMITRMEEESNV